MSMFMPSLYSENSPTNFSLSAWSSMELENSQEHQSTGEWIFDDNKLMDNQELIESESFDHVSDNIKGKEVNETENPQTTERPKRPKKRGIPWTEEEHKLFLLGLQRYGKGEWKNISRYFVMTKTPSQVASHAQKFKNRMNSSTPLDKRRPSINDIKSLNDSLSSLHPKRNLSNFQSTTQKNPVPNALHRPVVDHLPSPYVYNNNDFYNVGYQENQNLVPNAFQPPVVDQLPPPHVYNNNNYYYPVDHQQHHNLVPDAFHLPTIDQLQTPDLYNNNYCYNVDYKEFGVTSSNWRLNNGSFNSMTYQTWVNQQN